MFWILIFIASAIFIYVKLIKPHKYWEEKGVPHEKPCLIFGDLAKVIFRRTSSAELMQEKCKKFDTRYFGFYQLLSPSLIVQDPELIKLIGIKDFEHFIDHKSIIDDSTILGQTLFMLKGQKWRDMRTTLSPAFTSRKMKGMFILMSECADQFTENILKDLPSNQHKTFDMKDLVTRFANDVIATCAFGIECNSLTEPKNQFYLMGREATDMSGIRGLKFLLHVVSPSLAKLLRIQLMDQHVTDFFMDVVKRTMREREEKGIHRPDMINLLMEARKGKLKYDETVENKDEDTGFATVEESHVGRNNKQLTNELTDEVMTAQAMIFFLAGFDTISTIICLLANELAMNPDIQEKLQAEIDSTVEVCQNGKVTYDVLTRMKYLDMVLCETLRKWPVALQSDRICTKTYEIKPAHPNEKKLILHPGDHILIPMYAIHRDPKYYPNPDKFDPERFNDENMKNINPAVYIPFGLGPRNCIASRFALLEAKVFVFYMLSKMQLEICEKTQVPFKLSRSNLNLVADKGFWLGLKPKNQQN